jgi:hypothetical protein
MREFSGSHRSDALYQGLTLVGPLRPNQDLDFEPLRFFLCQLSVAVGVLLGSIDEPCFDAALNDTFAMLQKALLIRYPHVEKSTLPDVSLISEFPFTGRIRL